MGYLCTEENLPPPPPPSGACSAEYHGAAGGGPDEDERPSAANGTVQYTHFILFYSADIGYFRCSSVAGSIAELGTLA